MGMHQRPITERGCRMTRFEEIAKAAMEHSNSIEETKSFVCGVQWADTHPINVWHDPSEEPNGDEWHIAYIDVFGSIQSLRCPSVTFETYPSLAKFAAGVGMLCWAYIKDLLPKGGIK